MEIRKSDMLTGLEAVLVAHGDVEHPNDVCDLPALVRAHKIADGAGRKRLERQMSILMSSELFADDLLARLRLGRLQADS